MRKLLPLLAVVMITIGTAVSHAQTLTMTLGMHNCGPTNPAEPNCYNIPVTSSDGTSGAIWIDYHSSPTVGGFVSFLGNYEGLDGTQGWATVTAINSDGSVDFSGTDSNGRAYTGSLSFDYYTYTSCAHGCRKYMVITSGNLVIVYGGTATPQSPIAPTPRCGLTPPDVPCPPDIPVTN